MNRTGTPNTAEHLARTSAPVHLSAMSICRIQAPCFSVSYPIRHQEAGSTQHNPTVHSWRRYLMTMRPCHQRAWWHHATGM